MTAVRSRSCQARGPSRRSRGTAISTTRTVPMCPRSVAVNIRRRSYTIAAGARHRFTRCRRVSSLPWAGLPGVTACTSRTGDCSTMYNWLGEKHQRVTSSVEIPTGRHIFTAEFVKTGDDAKTMSAVGTLTLYIDMKPVGQATIMTQPGYFCAHRRGCLRRTGQCILGLAGLCRIPSRSPEESSRGSISRCERGALRRSRERSRGMAHERLNHQPIFTYPTRDRCVPDHYRLQDAPDRGRPDDPRILSPGTVRVVIPAPAGALPLTS